MKNTFGKPIIPPNEEERLKALHAYGILEAPPEESIQNLAAIVAQVFRVPIALVSLVDRERVLFKGNVGMAGIREVDRGTSLCSLAVLDSQPTVFENALQEPCLLSNPLVAGNFGLRFYAGAPITTSDGYIIGTVCIVDKQPRSFSEEDKGLLARFAAMAMHEIELRLAARQREEELERKVRERTVYLQLANDELERSNQELEQYAYVASHDLQEPLRKIQTFSSFLKDRHSSELSETASLYLSKISNSAGRMILLINELLQLSKLNRSRDLFQQVDLNTMLEGILNDFEVTIREKAAVVRYDKLPVLAAIPLQMNQLFHNLLSNALKFSQSGTPPVVGITAREISSEEAEQCPGLHPGFRYTEIEVRDNGIGFRQEYADKIFAIFHRLHDRQTYEGTGIGLAVCKKIVHNHKGEIQAYSDGAGSVFRIMLPLGPASGELSKLTTRTAERDGIPA